MAEPRPGLGLRRPRSEDLLVAAVALVAATPLAVILTATRGAWWLVAVVVPIVLVSLHLAQSSRRVIRAVAAIVAGAGSGALILAYGAGAMETAMNNIASPPQWDMQIFWVYGRVAAEGGDFYQFERAHELARSLFTPSDDFFLEAFFWYPPLTMLLVGPLGWFDPNTATAVWMVGHGLALLGSAFLLGRLFLGPRRVLGFLVGLAMILALNPTQFTVATAQTNFLALLLALLVIADRSSGRAGIWLVLGGVVKPVIAAMGLALLVRRRWRPIGVAVATGLVLVAVSILFFGAQPWITWLTANPTGAYAPDYLWFQGVNQSLLAGILRVTGMEPGSQPILHPAFVGLAAIIVVVSALVMAARRSVDEAYALSLGLVVGLLLYPSTLQHYMVLLLVPIAYLWSRRAGTRAGVGLVALLLGATILLTGVDDGFVSLGAQILVWVVLIGVGTVAIVRARRSPPANAGAEVVVRVTAHPRLEARDAID